MLWDDFRRQVPAATPLLFQLALSGLRPWALLRFARPADWLRFLAGAARHPLLLARILRFRRDHAPLWRTLVAAARQRTAEERARRGGGIPAPGLLTKQLS